MHGTGNQDERFRLLTGGAGTTGGTEKVLNSNK